MTTEPQRTPAAALMTSPTQDGDVGQTQDLRLLLRLLPFARPYLALLVAAFALMPLASGAALLQPYLIKRAVDAALVERSGAALTSVVWMYAAVIGFEFVTRFTQVYTMQLAGQRTMADLRGALFRHIFQLPQGYFDRTPVGRVVTRVTNDIESLGEFFGSGAVTALSDVLLLVGIVGFMAYLDLRLTGVALLSLPLVAFIVNWFRRFARDAFREIRARVAQLNAYMAEQVNGIAVIQALGREARCAAEYGEINAGYRDANHRAIRYDALLYSVVESVATASVAVVLWYASVRAGLLSARETVAYVGTVIAFYEYIQRFFVPIRDLSSKYTIIQASLAAAERIFGLFDVSDRDAPVLATLEAPAAADPDLAISFRDVSFGYRAGETILRDVSFDVRKGESIALVGATGAGKTTVTALLLRLYEISKGQLLIGGRDVRTLPVSELRQSFAVVLQDVLLFQGTVLENVALGANAPDEARARWALQQVGAWDLITRREGVLLAQVEERGANFSAGERQLLALARALYRDPPLLILDEATANIDSETEAIIQRAILAVLAGRTSIVIAHRLSTIEHADRILVFHRGQLVEEGSHAELLALRGVYSRLHALHFARDEAAGVAAAAAPT